MWAAGSVVNDWARIGGNTDGYAWKLGISGNVITRGGQVILGADNNDRIGIGLTNPDAKLHVNGSMRVNDWMRIGGNTDGYAWKLGVSGNIITRGGNVILAANPNDFGALVPPVSPPDSKWPCKEKSLPKT